MEGKCAHRGRGEAPIARSLARTARQKAMVCAVRLTRSDQINTRILRCQTSEQEYRLPDGPTDSGVLSTLETT